MALDPAAANPDSDATPVANDGWYLERKAQRFGPLDDDEIRAYFRAGMVKAGDTIAVPGQVGSVSAESAAMLLGVPAPAEKSAAAHSSVPVMGEQGQGPGGSWLIRIGGVVAIVGLLYFTLHEPLQPRSEAVASTLAPVASAEPVSVVTPIVEGPRQQAPTMLAPESRETPAVDSSQTIITSATLAAAAAEGDAVRSAGVDEWYERATILALAEDWSGMLAHASAWTVSQPMRDVAWWYRGVANAELGSFGESEADFKQALSISPNYFSARWSLANVYFRMNRYPEARVIMQDLARIQPANAAVWNDLGVAMDNAGEFDEAVAAYERAVQLKPDYRLAWVNLSKCYARFGYKDRSKAAAAKASVL